MNPKQYLSCKGICPACNKPLTPGVAGRIASLSDRVADEQPKSGTNWHTVIPLKEILAEILAVGPMSKKVDRAYHACLARWGTELSILLELPLDEIEDEYLREAMKRMRCGELHVNAGFDGQYGSVRLFTTEEMAKRQTIRLFSD